MRYAYVIARRFNTAMGVTTSGLAYFGQLCVTERALEDILQMASFVARNSFVGKMEYLGNLSGMPPAAIYGGELSELTDKRLLSALETPGYVITDSGEDPTLTPNQNAPASKGLPGIGGLHTEMFGRARVYVDDRNIHVAFDPSQVGISEHYLEPIAISAVAAALQAPRQAPPQPAPAPVVVATEDTAVDPASDEAARLAA